MSRPLEISLSEQTAEISEAERQLITRVGVGLGLQFPWLSRFEYAVNQMTFHEEIHSENEAQNDSKNLQESSIERANITNELQNVVVSPCIFFVIMSSFKHHLKHEWLSVFRLNYRVRKGQYTFWNLLWVNEIVDFIIIE